MTAEVERVSFKRMSDGTEKDFQIIARNDLATDRELPDRSNHGAFAYAAR